ncbi:MAG: DUF1232 domain-containing protein [Anaerolineales bacterium]|nr:DUF1232 domain-containing protein [Anaerolineales bacterium]MBK8823189.1 DUF1232 domain-containing protein [Anaerolineales bacterium]
MDQKKPSNLMVSQQGGVVRNVLNQLKLIFRLMGDKRVNVFAKIVPVGALLYLFSPDPIMFPIIGVVDDAALLWLGSYVFTELCPPAVVAEHMKELAGNMEVSAQDEVVDAEATDVSDKPS